MPILLVWLLSTLHRGEAVRPNTHSSLSTPAAEFVGAWEEVKAEEARRAEADAEVFKHKTRSTDIASEEQVWERRRGARLGRRTGGEGVGCGW